MFFGSGDESVLLTTVKTNSTRLSDGENFNAFETRLRRIYTTRMKKQTVRIILSIKYLIRLNEITATRPPDSIYFYQHTPEEIHSRQNLRGTLPTQDLYALVEPASEMNGMGGNNAHILVM